MRFQLVRILALCLLLLFSAGTGYGLEVPELKGRVNDYGGLLSPNVVRELETALASFEQQQSTQIVVLTIPSLENSQLEEFSIKVAEQWKIGHEGLDNGAILLVARNERKVRIEVGKGLEPSLTDLVSGRIIRNIIVPEFKKGDFDTGITAGVEAMMGAANGEFNREDQVHTPSGQPDTEGFFVMLLGLLFFIGKIFGRNKIIAGGLGGILASGLGYFILGPQWIWIILLFPAGVLGALLTSSFAPTRIRRGGGRRRSKGGFGSDMNFPGGGGFSGGFGGGGGSFGGGGASGDW